MAVIMSILGSFIFNGLRKMVDLLQFLLGLFSCSSTEAVQDVFNQLGMLWCNRGGHKAAALSDVLVMWEISCQVGCGRH